MSLQNRADKKRLNIIIVAEGAIDCHNKAITPDYIKDVSTVEKPAQVMDPQTLLQKHGFFFSLHGLLLVSFSVGAPTMEFNVLCVILMLTFHIFACFMQVISLLKYPLHYIC